MKETAAPERIGQRQSKTMIFEAARRLMGEHGFQSLTIKNICREAGVSNGTFFYHFKTKDDLLRYYLEGGFEGYLAEHETPQDDTGDFITQVVTLYRYYLDYCMETGIDFVSAYYSTKNRALDMRFQSSTQQEMNVTIMRDLGYLISAHGSGYLKPEVDVLEATLDCCTLVKGCVFEWCVSEGSFHLVANANRLLIRYLTGIASERYLAEYGLPD